MRTFELALILVNLFSLFLGLKKQSKTVWFLAVGVNLFLVLLHGVIEGFRYQMAFSYLLVVLFTVSAFLKTRDRFSKTATPKAIKFSLTSLALLFLAVTAFLASALPVFTLPKPTGRNTVGIQYFHFIDENRNDPFLDQSPQKRELMVKVYYPAKDDPSRSYFPYFHNSPPFVRLFAQFYNLPGFMFDHFNLVKTNSKEGLQLSEAQPSYPVVLFSHGAGTSMEVQTSQSEDLASHGYIVVAIDHTFVSAATVFPDRIVSHHEATTNFNVPEPAEVITQIMADDAKFVMDRLSEINEGKEESIFKGKLNLTEIGMIGHSVGGAVAYNLAIHDRRIKAAVDLDGVVYLTPEAGTKDIAPFLMLANDQYHVQALQNRKNLMSKLDEVPEEDRNILISIYGSKEAYQAAYDKAQLNLIGLIEVLKASGNLFTIEGSDHMKFTDIGLFFGSEQLRKLIGIGGQTDPARVLEITQAVTVAFFDQHLKGRGQEALEASIQKYPELKRILLN